MVAIRTRVTLRNVYFKNRVNIRLRPEREAEVTDVFLHVA